LVAIWEPIRRGADDAQSTAEIVVCRHDVASRGAEPRLEIGADRGPGPATEMLAPGIPMIGTPMNVLAMRQGRRDVRPKAAR
jgi:hypothetical protein